MLSHLRGNNQTEAKLYQINNWGTKDVVWKKYNSCKDQTIEDKTEYLPSTLLVNFSRWETKKKTKI